MIRRKFNYIIKKIVFVVEYWKIVFYRVIFCDVIVNEKFRKFVLGKFNLVVVLKFKISYSKINNCKLGSMKVWFISLIFWKWLFSMVFVVFRLKFWILKFKILNIFFWYDVGMLVYVGLVLIF